MLRSVDIAFAACTVMAAFASIYADPNVFEAPPKVIYFSAGSSVTLSWCVPAAISGREGVITFYLKKPFGKIPKQLAIAIVDKNGNPTILPTTSVHKSLFSKSQIDVLVSNCTINGNNIQLKNYSIALHNLSSSHARVYKIFADYFSKTVGSDNETKLEYREPPSHPIIKCTSGMLTTFGGKISLKMGSRLNCSCSVSAGSPSPVIFWKTPRGNKNNSEIFEDKISRNDNGTYICSASNSAGTRSEEVHVNVQYFELTCEVKLNTSGVFLKPAALGNPPPDCGQHQCNKEFKVSVNVAQLVYNTVGFGYCNLTLFFDKKLKCKSSSKEIPYTFVSEDPAGKVNTTLFIRDAPDIGALKNFELENGTLFKDGKQYIPEDGSTISKRFKKLCSGVSGLRISLSSALTEVALLVSIFIIIRGY